MKRTVIAVLVAGALLLAVGGSALAGGPAFTPGDPGGGSIAGSSVMRGPSSGINAEAGGAAGGVLGTRQTHEAGGVGGGVIGSRSGDVVLAGGPSGCCDCNPPWGGSSGCPRPKPKTLAGGVAGEAILATDPALAGGKGGIGGDFNY